MNEIKKKLRKIKSKINQREFSVGVIGLGYVGLPLCIRFFDEGFKTVGLDIDPKKIQKIQSGTSYIKQIDHSIIKKMVLGSFTATNDLSEVSVLDAIAICVPTPLDNNEEPDLSYVNNTLDMIGPFLKKNQILILESTTYPGTTEEKIVPFIENLGFDIGANFFIGYSPEREDPGNPDFSTKTIPKVISGISDSCLYLVKLLYDSIIDITVQVSSTRAAEMTKILENIHRAVNIGLVNELKIVADKMNINIYEVINAAATKPFGFTPYFPGPGLGGHCIPIDPFYLSWKAKKIGVETQFIELAGKVNTSMPSYVIKKSQGLLKDNNKNIAKSKILILGISYKKNVDDCRESPSYVLVDSLIKKGAKVDYSDPFFPKMPKTRKFSFDLKSVELNKKNLKSFDLVILATDHDSFDYELIQKESKLIVDTRGKFEPQKRIIYA